MTGTTQTAAPVAAPAQAAPEGADFLDFNELPAEVREKVEPRFKRLYWNVKEHERGLHDLGKVNQTLQSRLEELEAERTERQKISATSKIDDLKKQKVDALEKADYARAVEIDHLLIEATAPKAETKPAEIPAGPKISAEDERTVAAWRNEIDANGQFKRPWMQDAHPKYDDAARLVVSIAEDPKFGTLGMAEILKEADRRIMGAPQRPTGSASPPSTNTRPPSGKAVELSPEEKRTAERMYLPAKVVKTKEEAWERYRKQKS